MFDPLNSDVNHFIEDWSNETSTKNISHHTIHKYHQKLAKKLSSNYSLSFNDYYPELGEFLTEDQKSQFMRNLLWLHLADEHGHLSYAEFPKMGLHRLDLYKQFNQDLSHSHTLAQLEELYGQISAGDKHSSLNLPYLERTGSVSLSHHLENYGINHYSSSRTISHLGLTHLIKDLIQEHTKYEEELIHRLLTLWLVREFSKKGFSFTFLLKWHKPIFTLTSSQPSSPGSVNLLESELNILSSPSSGPSPSFKTYEMKWDLCQSIWNLYDAYDFPHRLRVGDRIHFKSSETFPHNIAFNSREWKVLSRHCLPRIGLEEILIFDKSGKYYISCEENHEVMRMVVCVKGVTKCRKHHVYHYDQKTAHENIQTPTTLMDRTPDCRCLCQTDNKVVVAEAFCQMGPSGFECQTLNFEIGVPTSLPTGVPTGLGQLIRLEEVQLDLVSILPALPSRVEYTPEFLAIVRSWIQFDVVLKYILLHHLHMNTLPNYDMIINNIKQRTVNKVRYYYNLTDLISLEDESDEALNLLKSVIGDELLSRAMASLSCQNNNNPDVEFRALNMWYLYDPKQARFLLAKSLNSDGTMNGHLLQSFIVEQVQKNQDLKNKLTTYLGDLRNHYLITRENYPSKI